MTYLYVKHFQWLDTRKQEDCFGEPLPKQVYKARFENNQYYISIRPEHNLVLPTLKVVPEDMFPFTCDIEELTPDNILDFDLSEETLDKIIDWMKQKPTGTTLSIENGLVRLGNEIKEQRQHEEAMDLARAYEIMVELYKLDSTKFEILLCLADGLSRRAIEEVEDPNYSLSIHPLHGTGVNMSRVTEHLSTYMSTDRRTNLNTDDLYEAITHIVNEIEQKAVNGQD